MSLGFILTCERFIFLSFCFRKTKLYFEKFFLENNFLKSRNNFLKQRIIRAKSRVVLTVLNRRKIKSTFCFRLTQFYFYQPPIPNSQSKAKNSQTQFQKKVRLLVLPVPVIGIANTGKWY